MKWAEEVALTEFVKPWNDLWQKVQIKKWITTITKAKFLSWEMLEDFHLKTFKRTSSIIPQKLMNQNTHNSVKEKLTKLTDIFQMSYNITKLTRLRINATWQGACEIAVKWSELTCAPSYNKNLLSRWEFWCKLSRSQKN